MPKVGALLPALIRMGNRLESSVTISKAGLNRNLECSEHHLFMAHPCRDLPGPRPLDQPLLNGDSQARGGQCLPANRPTDQQAARLPTCVHRRRLDSGPGIGRMLACWLAVGSTRRRCWHSRPPSTHTTYTHNRRFTASAAAECPTFRWVTEGSLAPSAAIGALHSCRSLYRDAWRL